MSDESRTVLNPEFKAVVDAKLDAMIEQFQKRQTAASTPGEPQELNKAYFQR